MVVLSSPKMSLVVMVVVPLVVLPLIILGRRLRVTSRLAQDRLADVAVEAEETVNAIQRFKLLGGNGTCVINLTMPYRTALMPVWRGSSFAGC